MRFWIAILACALMCGMAPSLHAQGTSDEELARYYFSSGEFDKALMYYERLYDSQPTSSNYKNYLETLIQLENYKDAEKLVKQHQKRTNNPVYLVDLGVVMEAQGDDRKAKDSYEEAIEELPASQSQVLQLANKFISRNKLDYAMQTYERGRQIVENDYPFHYEIATLYGSMGDHEKMVEEYLDLIEYNEAYLRTVQNAMNRSIDFMENEEKASIVKTSLLRRIQNKPDKQIFSEMLIWLYLQQRNFDGAFVQVRALDKRFDEQGQRMIKLGRLCMSNEVYEVAAKCFDYVMDKGRENPLYRQARSSYLQAEKQRLTREYTRDKTPVEELAVQYRDAIDEMGMSGNSIELVRDLSELLAYQLQQPDSAISLLERAVDARGINAKEEAWTKLMLADMLLAQGDIWDASLLYGQVEKRFKEDLLGAEAKFRNAKVSFYAGDFNWAQAQLDVLKGSTSELIANDAMDLSLLITDNLALDTVTKPMELYATADLLIFQNRLEEALTTLDSINNGFPEHSLSDEILFQKGRIAEKSGEFQKAADYYRSVIEDYNSDILADNALFKLAKVQENHLDDNAGAAESYKKLMVEFPGSVLVEEARRRFRFLRGDSEIMPGDEDFRKIEQKEQPQ